MHHQSVEQKLESLEKVAHKDILAVSDSTNMNISCPTGSRMEAKVLILVSCSCGGEHQRKMAVQSDIALSDLIEEVEAQFECSRGVELLNQDNNWTVLKDPVKLKVKSKLTIVKVCIVYYITCK